MFRKWFRKNTRGPEAVVVHEGPAADPCRAQDRAGSDFFAMNPEDLSNTK
jgi:hypothetical protein